MRHFNVTNSQSGFTLIEQLIVLILAGILSSMAIPNLMKSNQRGEVTQATNKIRSVLQIAQRQAIMKSKTCTLTLPPQNTDLVRNDDGSIPVNFTIRSNPADCLPMIEDEDRFPENMNLSATLWTNMAIDYQGKTTASNLIVLTHKGNSSLQKCIQISQPLGLVRIGDYDTATSTCKAVQ